MFDANGPVTGRPPVLDVELFLRFPARNPVRSQYSSDSGA
jgi:hypothetical protein